MNINKDELVESIISSTVEIFTGMVMMEVKAEDDILESLGKMQNSITGMVGLAGTFRGVMAVHLPNNVAMAITSSFLGFEVDEINEDVQDAIGEIANMLGGNLKTFLSDKGKDIQLSLPSTISGEEYTFMSQADVEIVIVPFECAHGKFFVEVELEQQ